MSADDIFKRAENQSIPGGCPCCDAVQIVRRDLNVEGIWHLEIQHDEGCLYMLARKSGTN
jgi:hypothetical protein